MINKSKVDEAISCFSGGFNCAQAILSTYYEEFGLDKKNALQLSCGFGAGMGRMCETCGAVTGAYLLIGLIYGKSNIDDVQAQEKTYSLIQEFANKFKKRNKTTLCRELLGVNLITGDKQLAANQVKLVCPKMVQDAAEIIEEILF